MPYSLEREPHVADEKEPDIRIRAPKTDASVPIEIKVAESWTLLELEAALTSQQIGRYLRAYNTTTRATAFFSWCIRNPGRVAGKLPMDIG